MQLKLTRDGLVDGFDLAGMNAGVLLDAVVVEVEDLSLDTVYVFEGFGIQILLYGLGHAADNHVQTEVVHDFPVHGLAYWRLFLEFHPDKVHKVFFA